MAEYRIADEPRPGHLARYAVNPVWPLLALMFGGVWISWPWFLLNGYMVGSPTLAKEVRWVVLGLAGALGLLLAGPPLLAAVLGSDVAALHYDPYLQTAVLLWKLWVSYMLVHEQGRTFEIFEHYHGKTQNGAIVLLAAIYFGSKVDRMLALVHPLLADLLA